MDDLRELVRQYGLKSHTTLPDDATVLADYEHIMIDGTFTLIQLKMLVLALQELHDMRCPC